VVTLLGVRVAAATAKDTIVAKLEWAKQGASNRQLVDVAGILRLRLATIDLAYVERWVSALDSTMCGQKLGLSSRSCAMQIDAQAVDDASGSVRRRSW
jgi:hypothetical protein